MFVWFPILFILIEVCVLFCNVHISYENLLAESNAQRALTGARDSDRERKKTFPCTHKFLGSFEFVF